MNVMASATNNALRFSLLAFLLWSREGLAQLIDPKPAREIDIGRERDDWLFFDLADDGMCLAIGYRNKLNFINPSNGKKVRSKDPLECAPGGHGFSPAGRYFLTGHDMDDGRLEKKRHLKLWDPLTGSKRAEFPLKRVPFDGRVTFCFSPDEKNLFYASGEDVHMVDLATLAVVHRLAGEHHSRVVTSLKVFPDGRKCLIGASGEHPRIWDAGKNVVTHLAGEIANSDGCIFGFSQSGKKIATLKNGLVIQDSITHEVLCEGSCDVRRPHEIIFWNEEQLLVLGPQCRDPFFFDVSGESPQEFNPLGPPYFDKESGVNDAHGLTMCGSTLLSESRIGGQLHLRLFVCSEVDRPFLEVARFVLAGGNSVRPVLSRNTATLIVPVRDKPYTRDILHPYEVAALFQGAGQLEAQKREAEKVAAIKRAEEKAAEEKARQQRLAEEELQQNREKAIAANQRPVWPDAEDLKEILQPFGGVSNMSLHAFIEWGTAERAQKATAGDRFDREDADDAAVEHRQQVRARKVFLQSIAIWDTRDDSAASKATSVRLRIPLFFKCVIAVPNTHDIAVSAFNAEEPWYLTSKGTLALCAQGIAEAEQRRAQNGIVYFPETHRSSELLITLSGERGILKAVARDAANHIVNLCFEDLRSVALTHNGFFRVDSLENRNYDSDSIVRGFNVGLNGRDEAPNYFAAEQRVGGKEPRRDDKVPVLTLTRCEVVGPNPEKREVLFEWPREGTQK